MQKKDTKLLRLASARLDVGYSLDAYTRLRRLPLDDPLSYHIIVSMAVSYGRPFFENHGVGTLFVDYPAFPDFADSEMNVRHHRLIDLRNKFMAHSSCEGTKILILPSGATNPFSGDVVPQIDHVVGKRTMGDVRFLDWLQDVVVELKKRLDRDVRSRLQEVFGHLKDPDEMDTGYDGFKWTIPKAP